MTMDNPTSSGNLFDLTGKVAVISGAAQGLGKAASLAVAQAGANVVLVDRKIGPSDGCPRTEETGRGTVEGIGGGDILPAEVHRTAGIPCDTGHL